MTVATGASEQQVQELGASPWDSQHREFDYDLDDIEGAIPGGLRGALYRIGPGRLDVDGHPLSHIFDGDGMVSRIDIGPEGPLPESVRADEELRKDERDTSSSKRIQYTEDRRVARQRAEVP